MPVKFPKKHAVIADRPFVIEMNKILEKKIDFSNTKTRQYQPVI